jgi:hypothetical protein
VSAARALRMAGDWAGAAFVLKGSDVLLSRIRERRDYWSGLLSTLSEGAGERSDAMPYQAPSRAR